MSLYFAKNGEISLNVGNIYLYIIVYIHIFKSGDETVLNMMKKQKIDEKETIRLYFEKAIHYPTLKTVIEVENVLKDSDMPLTKAGIKRKLKAKIMHQTLNIILAYLMERNMIVYTNEGFAWIYSPGAVGKLSKTGIRVR